MDDADFRQLVREHIATQSVLDLTDKKVHVSSFIELKHRECLRIKGGEITGSGHSIFKLTSAKNMTDCSLVLDGTRLVHLTESEDIRQIGACIFLMGRVKAMLCNCTLISISGFGVWAKHDCNVHLTNCDIIGNHASYCISGRTGIACFNYSKVTLKRCKVSGFSKHGICVRGSCNVKLVEVLICDCLKRGIYVYQNARMSMEGCTVKCIGGVEAIAAVEVNGIDTCVYFRAEDCLCVDNSCPDILVIGNVLGGMFTNSFNPN